MADYKFSVIIPVFNRWELTRDCLRSLREHTTGDDFEVIVADNASSDATQNELEPLALALFREHFRSLRFPENVNFGPACNTGAAAAGSKLLFFLNNDTLLTPGWSAPLLRALEEDAGLGAAGPLLLYPDNTVQHLGVTFSTRGVSHLYDRFPADNPVVRKKRRLQALTAAALLVPKKLFFEAGAFFKEYRNGFEDLELCLQIRKLGKKLACVPESRIYHLEGQSAGRADHDGANSSLFTRRCGELIYPDLHQHGLRDGFSAVYDDDLSQSLLVSDTRDRELRREVTDGAGGLKAEGLDILRELVRNNPYWVWGHESYGDCLAERGRPMEAAAIYARLVNFYPRLATVEKLMTLAGQAQDLPVLRQMRSWLEKMRAFKANKARQLNLLKQDRLMAGRFNDRFLLNLCEEKIKELT
jgi:GT2 family glycosyltransferase